MRKLGIDITGPVSRSGKGSIEKDAGLLGYFTRNNPRNYVPVFAGMSPRGVYGSGELTMATNVAGGLRDAGLNAVLYDPTPAKLQGNYLHFRRHMNMSPYDAMRAVMSGFDDPTEAAREASLYRLGRRYTMSPIESLKGRSVQDLMALSREGEFSPVLQHVNGATPDETLSNFKKFKKLLDRGAFDGITPGGLRDHLFRGRDAILNGKVVLGDPRQLWNQGMVGRGGSFFNGALGMGYSDMPYGKTPVVGGGRDLGKAVGFNANYVPGDTRPLAQSVIPFTDVGRTWADRVPFVSSFKRLAARRALSRYMAGELGVHPSELRGKKLVLLSGGASGENIPLKMQQVHDAIGGRGDVVFLVNAGRNQKVYDGAMQLADGWNRANGGARYVVSRGFAPAMSRRFAGAADLNLAYGGSSSLSETLANSNPYMFFRDTPLNERNIGWASERFGVPQFDSSGLAASDWLTRESFSPGGRLWRDYVGTKHVRGPMYNWKVPGLQKNPELGMYRGRAILASDPELVKRQLSSALNYMLDHPRSGWFDRLRTSSRFTRALNAANSNVVNTAVGANGGLYVGNVRLPGWLTRLGGIRSKPLPSSVWANGPSNVPDLSAGAHMAPVGGWVPSVPRSELPSWYPNTSGGMPKPLFASSRSLRLPGVRRPGFMNRLLRAVPRLLRYIRR